MEAQAFLKLASITHGLGEQFNKVAMGFVEQTTKKEGQS